MNLVKFLIVTVLIYMFVWTAAYIIFMGFDFRYYIEYLYFSWAGPGEIPAFIQWIAIIGTIFIVATYLLYKRLRKPKGVGSREGD